MQIIYVIVIVLVLKELDMPVSEDPEGCKVRESCLVMVRETHVIDTSEIVVAPCNDELGIFI